VTGPLTLVESRVVAQVQRVPAPPTLTSAPTLAPWAGLGIREEVSHRRCHRGGRIGGRNRDL
jgi:hypothetical protein